MKPWSGKTNTMIMLLRKDRNRNMQVYFQYKVFFILKNSQSCCSIMAVLGGDLEKVH
jgi:hypothetical protein